MRAFLLCCCIAFLSCGGDPVAPLLGVYSLIGASGENTVSGKTTPWSQPADPGTKLIITRTSPTQTAPEIDLTISGQKFVSAFVSLDKWGTFDTLATSIKTSDADCRYTTNWSGGTGNGVLESDVLTVHLTGVLLASCTVAPSFNGTGTEQLQATKDK